MKAKNSKRKKKTPKEICSEKHHEHVMYKNKSVIASNKNKYL